MTGDQLHDLTHDILDGDTISDDLFFQLLNNANALLEAARPWNYLKVDDVSKSVTPSDTFLTTYDLADDWAETLRIFVGESLLPYVPVSFELRRRIANVPRRYYIDLANNAFGFTGGHSKDDIIYHTYKKFSDDIEANTSPTFPARFHKLLSFAVAALHRSGIDADDFNALVASVNRADATAVLEAMEMWDDRINEANFNGQIHDVDISTYPDVVDTGDLNTFDVL